MTRDLREALDRARAALDDAARAAEAEPPAAGTATPAAGPAPAAGGARLLTPFNVALRFLGVAEAAGGASNPAVLAMLKLDAPRVHDDAVPWCSAFVNWTAWVAGYERSRSLRARSWLRAGEAVEDAADVRAGDVVVLKRGRGPQPGPEVIAAPGHVGYVFEAPSRGAGKVRVLGGNQGDRVSVKAFPTGRVLGVRRLRPAA